MDEEAINIDNVSIHNFQTSTASNFLVRRSYRITKIDYTKMWSPLVNITSFSIPTVQLQVAWKFFLSFCERLCKVESVGSNLHEDLCRSQNTLSIEINDFMMMYVER